MNLYYEYCKSYKLNKDNSDGFFDVVGDLYFTDEVQSLKQYEQHLDIDRLSHVTSVSYLSYKKLARNNNSTSDKRLFNLLPPNKSYISLHCILTFPWKVTTYFSYLKL